MYTREREGKNPLRIVDKKGFIKVQCSNGMVVKCPVRDYKEVVETIWKEAARFSLRRFPHSKIGTDNLA